MSYTDRQPWMSDDQWACAQLIADVFGGFHHLKPFKECADGVRVLLPGVYFTIILHKLAHGDHR